MGSQQPRQNVLERCVLPGGEALLEVAAKCSDVELVGGAVRDLLRGVGRVSWMLWSAAMSRPSRRRPIVRSRLAARGLSGANEHERFGTALVEWDGGRIDIATPRASPIPSQVPCRTCARRTPQEDLRRRTSP